MITIIPDAVTEYLRQQGFGLAIDGWWSTDRVLCADDLAEDDAKAIARHCGYRRVNQAAVAEVRRVVLQLAEDMHKAASDGPTTEEEAERAADLPDAYEPGQPEKSLKATMAGCRERYGKETSCGDEIAQALAGVKGDDLVKLAERNGIDLLERWGHLNPGQQRMCFGNVLRARVRRGEKVVI